MLLGSSASHGIMISSLTLSSADTETFLWARQAQAAMQGLARNAATGCALCAGAAKRAGEPAKKVYRRACAVVIHCAGQQGSADAALQGAGE